MIYFEDSSIQSLVIHKVGNKGFEDALVLSDKVYPVDEKLQSLLTRYFLPAFKSEVYYNLYHDSGLEYNVVYGLVSQVFANPDSLCEKSVTLAKYLYDQSMHPKIKAGEFYVVFFKDCIFNGNTMDAVGLFKSENKEVFLKVLNRETCFELETDQGININKLDKGCMIFNTEAENGYVVAVVDNTNRGEEAQYWIDDFLHVRQRQDDYFKTHNLLSMCKNFVTEELPDKFEVSKADQADLLNKSVKFFKNNDTFNMEEFSNEVIAQPDVIESFHQFKNRFVEEQKIDIPDEFDISDTAVKKQSRVLKSVIKLDKNFHIYIHGDRNLIEQGEDEKGKFYKMYFKEEV